MIVLSERINQIIEKAIDDLIEEAGGIENFVEPMMRFGIERKIRSTLIEKTRSFMNQQY